MDLPEEADMAVPRWIWTISLLRCSAEGAPAGRSSSILPDLVNDGNLPEDRIPSWNTTSVWKMRIKGRRW